MDPMTQDKIAEVLERHNLWLIDPGKGEQADLRGAKLQYADLQYAKLRGANLQGADLQGADLRGAKLQGADLQYAKLRGANLQCADLQYADIAKVHVGSYEALIYGDGRMRYGCVEMPLSAWADKHDELAEEHAPGDAAYYAAITRALAALGESLLEIWALEQGGGA